MARVGTRIFRHGLEVTSKKCNIIGKIQMWKRVPALIRGHISRAQRELSEDKSPNFGHQEGWTINNHSSRSGGCSTSSWRVCQSWLPCPLINSKLCWYLTLQCHHSCGYAESRQPDLEVKNSHFNQAELYNNCRIFPYSSECWAVTKRDVLKIDALDQWCLQKLLGITWYHHLRNDEVRRTTGQPRLLAVVQARCLSLFSHIALTTNETDAKKIMTVRRTGGDH